MATNNSELIKRLQQLHSDRAVVQSMWDAIETFITPYRGRFFNDQRDEGSIEWFRHREVYDSTAVMAHQNLAASMHASLTSPAIQWFDIRFREDKLNKNKQAADWVYQVTEMVYYALQDSNFNLEINETYQDLGGFGTSFLMQEETDGPASEWNGMDFHSIPLKEAFFDQDNNGQVARFFRKLQWTPSQILSKFGDKVPQVIKDLDERGSVTKRDVIFAVFPRNNKIIPLGESVNEARRPWEYRYIDAGTQETMGKPGGYYEMPVYAARWRKTSSSQWGNSPAMIALADVLSLNEARKMQLIASEKLIDPPILAEERALVTDLRLKARSLSVVRNIEGIQAFNTEGSLAVSDHMIDQLQASVRSYFFTDQINYPQPQGTPMTATEAQIRYELMQRLLGPTLGRLQNDLLDPIVARTFRMLARKNQIPEPPQIVLDMDAEFDVEYLGALVRAQRNDRAVSIERLLMTVGNGAAVLPEMLDSLDPAMLVNHLAKDLNVPPDVLRGEKEVKKVQEQRQAQQKAAAAAELATQQGDAMQATAGATQQVRALNGSAQAPN